jgi:hypothetical protein
VFLKFIKNFTASASGTNASQLNAFLTSQQTLHLADDASVPAQTVKVLSVSPFGRGAQGLQQSGRCVSGNEYAVLQAMRDPSGVSAANPLSTGSLTTAQQNALTSSGFAAMAAGVIPLISHFPSPYLLMPGDRLVLSISKMRPYLYGGAAGIPQHSGSNHDIFLKAGDINVTLYGSLAQSGNEFHDTLNQTLGSNVVHELIGAEPVLDEFDVPYRNELSGSFTDNVMMGTLTPNFANYLFDVEAGDFIRNNAYDVRDRKLSWLNARNAPQLSLSAADVALNPYKSFRAQPWWERAGSVRQAQFIDSTERYWDSMMPSVSDCFRADGCGIFITTFGAFGSSYQIDTGPSGSLVFNPKTTRMGWIWMDYGIPYYLTNDYAPLINVNWNKAFPYEPRYNGASRQLDIARSLVATYLYGGYPAVQPIAPTQVNGFALGTTALATSIYRSIFDDVYYLPNTICYEWFVDANLTTQNVFGYYVTGSMTTHDTARALFGFGDRNTYFKYDNGDNTTSLIGSNHLVEGRDVEGPHPDGVSSYYDNNYFRFSPQIRGWKYGVHSGIPSYSKAYWRRNRFGQFRDMLEQRQFTKFYQAPANSAGVPNFQQGVQPAAVTVTFLDPSSGRLTAPANTWSSNLDLECTSSLPYFDGAAVNRPTIVPGNLNLHPNVIKSDGFGNVSAV